MEQMRARRKGGYGCPSSAMSALAAAYGFVLLWLLALVALPSLILGWSPTVVVSGSMAPNVAAGAVALVEATSPSARVAAGDIIVFADPARPGRRVTHRVVDVHPDGTYQTKGDANAGPDSTPVHPSRVEGTVRAVVPAVGLPVVWARDGRFLTLLAWSAASLLALVSCTKRRHTPVPGAVPRPVRPGGAGSVSVDVLPGQRRLSRPYPVRRGLRRITAVSTAAAVVLAGSGAAFSAFSDQTWADNSLAAADHFTPGFVKTVGTSTCGATSSVITVPAEGVPAGNTLIVRLVLREQTAADAVTVVDSAANAWSIDNEGTHGRIRAVVASAHVANALPGGATITISHPSAKTTAAAAVEFAGIAATNRVDAAARGGGASALPSATLTTTTPNDVIYAVVGSHNRTTTTEAADWTSHAHQAVDCGGQFSDSHGAFRTAATAADYTYAPTLSASVDWVNLVVAYRLDDRIAPDAPVLSGFVGDGETELSWSSRSDPWLPVTYQLFRDGVQVYSGTGTTFTDTGLVNGTAYAYVVRASDGGENQSGDSNLVSLIPEAGASIRFVKTVGSATCGTTSTTVAVPAGGVAVGSTVVVRAVLRDAATTAGAVTATDDAGNAYSVDADAFRSTALRTVVLSAPVSTALAEGQQITVTHPTATSSAVDATEFSGLMVANRLDLSAVAADLSPAPAVSGTTTTKRTLVYGVVGTRANRTQTAPSGWTPLATQTAACSSSADSNAGYVITTKTDSFSYNPALSASDEWAAGLVAYRSVHDDTPPPAPTLSGTAGDGKAVMSWNSVTDPSEPVTYGLYRDGALVYSGPGTTFDDTTVTNGIAYDYVVIATDGAVNNSPASNTVRVTPTPLRFVQHVGSMTCAAGVSSIAVPAGGIAAGHTLVVRVGIREGSPEVGGVSAVDSAGNTYTVDADALRAGRVRTIVLSAYVELALAEGQTIDVTHPAGVASVVAVAEVAGVAERNRVDAAGVGSNNSATPVATVTTASNLTFVVGAVTTRGNRTHASPAAWTAMPGFEPTCGSAVTDLHGAYRMESTTGTYSYDPILVEGGDEWAAAAVAYRAAVDVTAPAAPVLSGVGGYKENTLSWDAVDDVSTPVVYTLTRDGAVVYTGTATTFTDTGLVNGHSYRYVVRATDDAGNDSVDSNAVDVSPSPIRLVQTVGSATCGGPTSTITVPSGGVRAGSTVLVRVVVREGSDTGTVAAADSAGHSYTVDADAVRAGRVRTVILSTYASAGLAAGETITVTHPDGKAEGVLVDEFEGIASENRLDAAGIGSANSALPTATVTTATDRVLLYGAVGTRAGATYTAASGWTSLTGIAQIGCSSSADSNGGYRIVASTGSFSFNPTLSSGDEWAAGVVAYRSSTDATAPATPALSGTPGNAQNTLSWSSVTDPTTPVTYQLFRDTTKIYDGTATTFTDTGLENGLTYRYTVQATDGVGNVSLASPELELVPTTIAFVQSVGHASCGGTSNTVTVPAAGVAAGSRLIVRVVVREGADTGAVSAVDSAGNTYAIDADAVRPTKVRTIILSAHITAALASNDTITVTHPSGKGQVVDVAEFTGIAATNPVQTTGVGSGNSATPAASLTTATRSTLVFGGVGTRAVATASTRAEWTTLPYRSGACASTVDTSAAYQLLSTARTVTYDPTLSSGDEWAAAIVAYLPG